MCLYKTWNLINYQKNRQQKVTVLLSEVIKNKEATNEYFLGHSDKKKIQALPKKMGECHDINYVEYVYYVIMYLIINN